MSELNHLQKVTRRFSDWNQDQEFVFDFKGNFEENSWTS
jgi:hypothetical protein